ncbi:MAG: hypothetical protein WCP12_09355 [bacterium]
MNLKILKLKCAALLAISFYSLSCLGETRAYDYGADPMRYLSNSRLRLGVDLSLGGAVTVLEDKANGDANMINSHDWGRQIQLSYYSGPTPYIGPNGEKPHEEWAKLGWNPIQSGSVGKVKSKTIAFEQPDPTTFRVRCIPMQWPHLNVPGECIFEVTYRLVGVNAVEMTARIINSRSDKTHYPARHQEMPALYTNGPWYKLVTYTGDEPFSNQPVTTLVNKGDNKGWPWLSFSSSERWAALVNEQGKGVGVYQPDVTRFTAGFAGGDTTKGAGGPKESPTGYIAPIGFCILDANIDWTYKAYLIVGSVDEIRGFVSKRHTRATGLSWIFEKDRLCWYYQGEAIDTGWPIKGALNITYKNDPHALLVGPETFWHATEAPVAEIEAAFSGSVSNQTCIAQLVIRSTGEHASLIYPLDVTSDGIMRTYRVKLNTKPAYIGAMKQLLLRFPETDGSVRVRRISLGR